MEIDKDYIFQVDNQIVKDAYANLDNYEINFNEDPNTQSDLCVIYFSSNNIYYPNNKDVFKKDIVIKNKFEWFGTKIQKARKHIYIRDVHKQWYLTGINATYNTPNKLLEFLKEQTKGYRIITLGSSAGGYAAVLYGQQLEAVSSYSFNGQFEINSLLQKSTEQIDPIVFRNQNNKTLASFYDIKSFIINPSSVYYFRSNKSEWDMEQYEHVKDKKMQTFSFKTNHHGIPFIKSTLPSLLNINTEQLIKLNKGKLNPLFFSIRVAGLSTTIKGIYKIILFKLKSLKK